MRIGVSRKVDFAEILTGLSQKDKDAFGKINQTLGLTESPNLIRNVFKNRRGEFTNGKLWCKVDLGTCRFTPLFWTDNDYNVIPVPELNIQVRK